MNFYKAGLIISAVLFVAEPAAADEYPSKTIDVVTHSGAGESTDITTRMLLPAR